MKFKETQIFNIEGAMRGMRFPMKGIGDTVGDIIGEKDMHLANRLYLASQKENLAHSKFLRQILISVDITAPLYFWSELDTYKVGTTANSESTMHKLTKDAKHLTPFDFEIDPILEEYFQTEVIPNLQMIAEDKKIDDIARLRLLKQLLPSSYLQKRHWTANYEIIRNIFNQRKDHRLKEWNTDFVNWVYSLPYSQDFLTRRNIDENISD